MQKARYLELLKKVKEASEDISEIELDSIFDELDEIWSSLSDEDQDELNDIDTDDL